MINLSFLSQVWGNIYEIHYDPKIWEDPKEFRPERFLDESGKPVRNEHWIPFSMGKQNNWPNFSN